MARLSGQSVAFVSGGAGGLGAAIVARLAADGHFVVAADISADTARRVAGAVGGPVVQGDLRTIYLNDLTLFGATHQPREVFAGLVTIINTARIRPVVSKTYPLRDIAAAQADLAAGRYPGKLVLVPSEPSQ